MPDCYFNMKKDLLKQTQKNYAILTNTLIDRGITITLMESCTSGLISSFITDVDNSSKVFKGSFITYSNKTKIENGVNKEIINNYGVYSIETSKEMARACKNRYNTNIGVGITGSLGIIDPNNLDSEKGQVYFTIDYLKPNSYSITIEKQESKFLNKVYAANVVCLKLLELLEGEKYDKK